MIPFSLERRTLGGFGVRRFFRLYPTLWVCGGVTILVVVLLSGHAGFPYSGSTIGTSAEISYPLYLLHTIVGWVMLSAVTRLTDSYYVALFVTLPTVLALAVAVHHFVERPSMELGRRIANRPRFRRTASRPGVGAGVPVASGDQAAIPGRNDVAGQLDVAAGHPFE